jgi:hypothetical protein
LIAKVISDYEKEVSGAGLSDREEKEVKDEVVEEEEPKGLMARRT